MDTEIRRIFNQWREQDLSWSKDKRYSPEHIDQQRDQGRTRARRAILAEVQAQLGTLEKPGSLWRQYQGRLGKVKKLQAEGPSGIDYARLNFELQRARSKVATAGSVGELAAWYDQADSHQKMALQSLSVEITSRFKSNATRAGSFLARLQADEKTMQRSPELAQAEAELKELNLEIRNLIDDSELAAKELGELFRPISGLAWDADILRVVKEFSAPYDQGLELGELVRTAPQGGVVWPETTGIQNEKDGLIVPEIPAPVEPQPAANGSQ